MLMLDDDPVVRMRAADAIEKVTRDHPEYLAPHRTRLLEHVAGIEQQEVRWHVAQMIPRLELTPTDINRAEEILLGYLDDRSRIVKTEAMQALADLTEQAPDLLPIVMQRLEELTRSGSPAMKSRGRNLVARLRANAERAQGQSGPQGIASPVA
jgi:hypothetical protein